jgi:hypothetical protein
VKVRIWDRGTYEAKTFSEDEIVVFLRGEAAGRQLRNLSDAGWQLAGPSDGFLDLIVVGASGIIAAAWA